MSRFFTAGILLFLLLGAGYGLSQAARYIPWDCSDWAAFAHADRTTAILESLAENRGKTLYCGIDQSDTFAKAETWAAGKDRNERDGTVYDGERGRFRGFIAAQEGWLTDGESGITGQSIAHIFEFPKEERRRTKKVKRLAISSGDLATDTCMTDLQEGRQPGTLICSNWGTAGGAGNAEPASQAGARYQSVGRSLSQGQASLSWTLDRETNTVTRSGENDHQAIPSLAQWTTLAKAAALSVCRSRGYPSVINIVIGPGHSRDTGAGVRDNGDELGWFYWDIDAGANYNFRARQSRSWTATCKKVIRRTRKLGAATAAPTAIPVPPTVLPAPAGIRNGTDQDRHTAPPGFSGFPLAWEGR